MRTILDILKKAGGWHPGLYLKIDNRRTWPWSSRPSTIRPMGFPPSRRALRRTERRPDARPGDVLRAWSDGRS